MAKKQAKRKPKPYTKPTLCGSCMAKIDRPAIEKALFDGAEYRCECGRVLVKER